MDRKKSESWDLIIFEQSLTMYERQWKNICFFWLPECYGFEKAYGELKEESGLISWRYWGHFFSITN